MDIEIHYDLDGEWAALYVDGQLDRVGDAYLAEERAFELLGVKVVQDDAFLRGQDQRDGVAPTVDEIAAYVTRRDNDRVTAEQMRQQAAELLAAAADDLDHGRPGGAP